MQVGTGKSILNGIAIGKLKIYKKKDTVISAAEVADTAAEVARFEDARAKAIDQQTALYEKALAEAGEDIAEVFNIHAMLLEDNDFEQSVHRIIREEETCAEWAVWKTGGRLASTFTTMDNLYMRARAGDIRDITYRVIWHLRGERMENPLDDEPTILVADEFLPSEVIELDRSRVVGILARKGSVDSHTALLLRACRIPAMAEVDLDECWDGHTALLDGTNHQLYLDPDPETLRRLLPEENRELAVCE